MDAKKKTEPTRPCQCPRCGRMHIGLPPDGQPRPVIDFAGWTLDPERHTATLSGKTVKLQANSFRLALYFAERPNRVITRELICDLLGLMWRNPRNADVYIKRLRHAFDFDARTISPILTHRGIGYEYVP